MSKNQPSLAKIGGVTFALLLSFSLGQQASADTLVENLSQTPASSGSVDFGNWQGSSFTTGSGGYNLDSVTLFFQENLNTPDLFVRLYNNNSGKPGTVITSFNAPPTITNSYDNNTFSLNSPQILSANTTYWLVSGVSSNAGTNNYEWVATTSLNQTGFPGWTIGDGYVLSQNQSTSWQTVPLAGPYQFSVNGTERPIDIPEPSSVVALLGLGGLGLVSSLKKRT